MRILNVLPLASGELRPALSHQKFNQKERIVTTRNVAFKISVCADSPNIYFIFSLLDNLFKPKERFIPEKEMHMRSKRYEPLHFGVRCESSSPHT